MDLVVVRSRRCLEPRNVYPEIRRFQFYANLQNILESMPAIEATGKPTYETHKPRVSTGVGKMEPGGHFLETLSLTIEYRV